MPVAISPSKLIVFSLVAIFLCLWIRKNKHLCQSVEYEPTGRIFISTPVWMSWHWRREPWRGLSGVAEMEVLALDTRLIQLLVGKYRERAGCPLEKDILKDILDGRQSNVYQDPADHGISPVPYKWNCIHMLAESSIPMCCIHWDLCPQLQCTLFLPLSLPDAFAFI